MLIKKILLTILLLITFIFDSCICCFASDVYVSAQSAVVINADTKEIIFEKTAYRKLSMASTTKIMTSLIAIESGRLNELVTVDAIASEGSSMGLKEGDKLTLESLVYGMLLESGNDAAESTAEFFSGNEDRFCDVMNKKAFEIGMNDTNFETASGLDSENHYSTAFDMAILGAHAIKNPIFKKICSTKSYCISFIESDKKAYFQNHNRLLSNCDGVFGIKTGFTKKSGRCLVTACERDGVVLVAVTLNAPDDWNDHKRLYDFCFSKLESQKIDFDIPKKIKIYGSLKSAVKVKPLDESYLYSYINKKDIETEIILPEFVYAPLKQGDVIGKINISLGEDLIFSTDILADENADRVSGKAEKYKSFKERLIEKLFTMIYKN